MPLPVFLFFTCPSNTMVLLGRLCCENISADINIIGIDTINICFSIKRIIVVVFLLIYFFDRIISCITYSLRIRSVFAQSIKNKNRIHQIALSYLFGISDLLYFRCLGK